MYSFQSARLQSGQTKVSLNGIAGTMKRSLKAVLIDDEHSVLSLIRQILERRGYAVQTFDDPVKSPLYAQPKCPCPFKGKCPDLVISDYRMSPVSGVELLESSIKRGCQCRHYALISGTGFREPDLTKMAKYGTRFFLKPIDLDDFYPWLDRVEHEIAQRRPA